MHFYKLLYFIIFYWGQFNYLIFEHFKSQSNSLFLWNFLYHWNLSRKKVFWSNFTLEFTLSIYACSRWSKLWKLNPIFFKFWKVTCWLFFAAIPKRHGILSFCRKTLRIEWNFITQLGLDFRSFFLEKHLFFSLYRYFCLILVELVFFDWNLDFPTD